jgi:predicted alpha/beta-fold hydrolase
MTDLEGATARFEPPRLLRNPHVQTLLASVGRKPEVARRAATLLARSRAERIVCTDGVVLEAWVSAPGPHRRSDLQIATFPRIRRDHDPEIAPSMSALRSTPGSGFLVFCSLCLVFTRPEARLPA